MSLGVLNNIAAIYSQNNLNQTQSSLQNTLTQLSSGSRINSGADDAAGLALADGLHANVAALTQSAQNATAGVGLLQTADGALSQVTNLLNRAVTLATQAANGTLNGNQVSSANQEYQNILTEIGNIGSTTNYNGNSVFTNTAKAVFVSDGTSSGATTFNEVVGTLTAGSVGTSAPPAAASTTITNPTPVAATGTTGGTATFALGAATDTVSGSINVTVGGTSSAVAAATTTASGAGVSATATFSLGTSTDTIGGNVTLAIGAGAAATYAITAGSTLASAVTQLNGTAAFTAAGLVASQGIGANANKLIITGPTGAGNNLADTSTLTDSVGGTAVSSTLTAGTTLAAAVTQLNAQASFSGAGLVASQGTGANANQLIITGPTGASNALSLTGTSLSQSTVPTAGAGVDFTNSTIATLSATSATTVLTSLTTAIQNVAYQRGSIGANINQLNAASNVASAASVNLTAAENSVRATNYGQATSDMAKFKVLSQTGIAALSQANSVQQDVLKLLQ